MRLERSDSSMVIHNRRFARRGGAHAHFTYPNPSTRAWVHQHVRERLVREAPMENFTPVFPAAAPTQLSPLDDANFVAECADGIINGISNAVIGLDADGIVKTCNSTGLQMLGLAPAALYRQAASDVFTGENAWIATAIAQVLKTRCMERIQSASLLFGAKRRIVNAMVFPLLSNDKDVLIGAMIMLDDVSAQREMETTISHYMNPGLVDRLLADGGEQMKSKDTVATVLFSDVRGFTAITEEIGAQKTVKLLNKYFTLMVECIEAENGAVDKFAGDSLMAGFGINREKGDEADRAVRAGIAMQRALDTWNAQRRSEGRKAMQIGIGIATDLVVSGAVGSPKRMDYTLIGDGVNLASRLESACKYYGSRFLIAESTFKKLKGSYKIREIDEVIVQGRSLPVRIYEVLGYRTSTEPDIGIQEFEAARADYIAGNWDKAIARFWEVLARDPEDKVCTIYIDRCERLKALAPLKWDGVCALESK